MDGKSTLDFSKFNKKPHEEVFMTINWELATQRTEINMKMKLKTDYAHVVTFYVTLVTTVLHKMFTYKFCLKKVVRLL